MQTPFTSRSGERLHVSDHYGVLAEWTVAAPAESTVGDGVDSMSSARASPAAARAKREPTPAPVDVIEVGEVASCPVCQGDFPVAILEVLDI